MKTLIYISSGIIITIILHACHPDQSVSAGGPQENNLNINSLSAKSDSTQYMESDPPKDRDHWKPTNQ